MMRLFAAATTVLFAACCVRAADKAPAVSLAADQAPAVSRAADPAFALAHMDKNGEVCIETLHRVPKAEIHTEKRTKDGAIIEVPVAVTLMVPRFKEEKVKLEDLRAFDVEGKSIDPRTLPERLKKETVVLLSTDGAKVDPRFLAAVKEGTLVLVPPVTRTDANPAPRTPVEKR